MKKTLKKTLSIIIAILMIATTMPIAFAAGSGTCGASTNDGGEESVTWTLDSTGVLTISGTGAMADYAYNGTPFYYNADIKTVVIENGVTSIGKNAFYVCTSLASVTIPDSVTSIGDYAFRYCKLASIEIPDSVTSIGEGAFEYCTSLASVTIPDSVTSIGYYAFRDCSVLDNITVDEDNEYYSSENGVLFNKDKTTLIQYPTGNSRISYTIPDGVTSIGEAAFYDCTSLASITIPNSVTSIGGYAFDYTACYNDENNWENGVLYIGNHLIAAEYDISGNYSVKSGTKTIACDAFAYCTSLESIEIPDSVTSIGDYAFYGCTSLASVTIPDSVTSIGKSAFLGCTSLASIEIPDSVTSIGYGAFWSCTSLESVIIPDSVTSIDIAAFDNCTSLTLVHYLGTSEQWDGIEIGSYGNDELTGATRHYCTEADATVTCTEDGYTTGWYCADCEEYVVGGEETAALGHVDADGDYVCDNGCGHEFEKPVAPTPDTPDEPTANCKHLCHCANAFIQFFWKIVNFIQKLFGMALNCICGATH